MITDEQRLWDYYVNECGVLGVKPDISDYVVWLEEQGIESE